MPLVDWCMPGPVALGTRDFSFNYNRTLLCRATGMESIDRILTMKVSMFVFKVITELVPTNLAGTFLSRGYFNERDLGPLSFFDFGARRIGGACLTNSAGRIVSEWNFDWFFMTQDNFKSNLKLSFDFRL